MPLNSIPRSYENRTAAIICTGPSLSPQQLAAVNEADVVKFGVNNTWNQLALDVHVTVNPEWWHHYWPREGLLRDAVHDGKMEAWCIDLPDMERYTSINTFCWLDEEAVGVSINNKLVNIGHSSGFAALNIAYLMGCSKILLLGHDMKFPDSYNAHRKVAGGDRHYFGEYPEPLQHWPSVRVNGDGVLQGLLDCYAPVVAQQRYLATEIINCTPGSALEGFERRDLLDCL